MKVETKVGLLFLLAVALTVSFAYLLGALNPFSNSNDLYVTYNFAGGIEVGSPVRVMGIKVGKVKKIQFDPGMKDKDGEEVKLKVKISVAKKAWKTVRGDSQYFINLAGVIGEKFLEISPGSMEAGELKPGDVVRGVDPPRIDQLISQSYGLAGKIIEIVEKNEGSLTDTIDRIGSLVTNLNKTLVLLDKLSDDKKIGRLVGNIVQITDDLAAVSGRISSKDAQKTYDLIHKLVWRLDELDSKSIRQFLQEEGIKAKIF